jgi:predicted porin
MTGGLARTASRLAIATAFCMVGASFFAQKQARAADLGGDCCANLEDRVAELEATTVRKGNKKVTVQLYGKMNWAVEWWNDGHEQNMYTVNNDNESNRFGLIGKAKIQGDWSAGYRFEAEMREALSSRVNQFDDNANDSNGTLKVRWSSMYINNKTWGEVRWGLTATPKYDITKYALETLTSDKSDSPVTDGLSDTMVSDYRMNDGFRLRPKGPNALNNANGLSTITWSNIARCFGSSDQFNCSTRRNGVNYISPTFLTGFSFQVGEFEDRDWGASLRYTNTFSLWGGGSGASSADTWQIAAGAAYEQLRDERLQTAGGGLAGFSRDFEEEAGSVALKHKPSGLFAEGIWSTSASNDSNAIGAFNGKEPPLMTAWVAQGGIIRKLPWLGLDRFGETSFWGGYEDVRNGFAQGSSAVSGNTPLLSAPAGSGTQNSALGAVRADGTISGAAFPGILDPHMRFQVVGTDVPMWFLALDQDFASAAMHLYLVYQHFSEPEFNVIDKNLNHTTVPLEGFDTIYTGGRMYF